MLKKLIHYRCHPIILRLAWLWLWCASCRRWKKIVVDLFPWSISFDGTHLCLCPKLCNHLKVICDQDSLLRPFLTGGEPWNVHLAGIGGVTLSQSLIWGTGLVSSLKHKSKLGFAEVGELSTTDIRSELVTRDKFKFGSWFHVCFRSDQSRGGQLRWRQLKVTSAALKKCFCLQVIFNFLRTLKSLLFPTWTFKFLELVLLLQSLLLWPWV